MGYCKKVFGQLAVQCNSQLADATTKQPKEIKVQLAVVHEIKRAS